MQMRDSVSVAAAARGGGACSSNGQLLSVTKALSPVRSISMSE
jgi:hypothetical protein